MLSIDRDKKSSRVSRIQLARETCVATCRGSDALFPESNSGPRNAAGNPAVAVLVPVIGKGLLARISQSGDFFPTFCAFGPTPFRGPFLPGRGLKRPLTFKIRVNARARWSRHQARWVERFNASSYAPKIVGKVALGSAGRGLCHVKAPCRSLFLREFS